jgi:hypothetical protein
MSKPYQRKGATSNKKVGDEFRDKVRCYLRRRGLALSTEFTLKIGIDGLKEHKFDLGSRKKRVIVECKSHRWTEGGHAPSAKMRGWNEAMYLFFVAPRSYRKILFVLRDYNQGRKVNESLGQYYIRTYYHLIPPDVEIHEFDEQKLSAEKIK